MKEKKLEIIKTNKGFISHIYNDLFEVVKSGDFREAEIYVDLPEYQKQRFILDLNKQGYTNVEFVKVEVKMKI